jgi:threonine/homoserine/homoserine lactone efflux protein
MSEIVISGLVLGLSAGFAPGPLMALVLAQTLRHGSKEGVKTALAPLLTDAPVILLSLLVTAGLAHLDLFLGLVSLAGGLFVGYLAVDSFRPPRLDLGASPAGPRSWTKGVITNFLSPHPWLFWFTVGAATLAKAHARGWLAAAVFLLMFYLCLCGTKVAMALVAGRSRAFLSGRAYRFILAALGIALGVFALRLLRDALGFFHLI